MGRKVNVTDGDLAWIVRAAQYYQRHDIPHEARVGDELARKIQATFTRMKSREHGIEMPEGYDWTRVPSFLTADIHGVR